MSRSATARGLAHDMPTDDLVNTPCRSYFDYGQALLGAVDDLAGAEQRWQCRGSDRQSSSPEHMDDDDPLHLDDVLINYGWTTVGFTHAILI